MVARNYSEPPIEGACTKVTDRRIFWRPQNESDAAAAIRICGTCDKQDQCSEWAEAQIAESNRDRPEGAPVRVPLSGVIAGVWYTPTDLEGRPVDLVALTEKANLRKEKKMKCISEGCDNPPGMDGRQCGECIALTYETEREI